MNDAILASGQVRMEAVDIEPNSQPADFRQPDASSFLQSLLAAMLDEVDVPMLLVDGCRVLIHANRVALRELQAGQHPLELSEGRVRVRDGATPTSLSRDLTGALGSPFRRVIGGGQGDDAPTISVIPLDRVGSPTAGPALLVLGRRRLCPSLTVDWFARAHSLTSSEARVLALLCAGLRPQGVAEHQGVSISTVRTQLMSIRSKTLAGSINDLVAQVARLPPMIGLYEPAC